VKEYYFHLGQHSDALLHEVSFTNIRSAPFPMDNCWRKTGAVRKKILSFELLDTGVFNENRYFDVVVEYAKAASEEHPHSHHRAQSRPRSCPRAMLFRPFGSAIHGPGIRARPSPIVKKSDVPGKISTLALEHPEAGKLWLHCQDAAETLFTEMKRMPSASTGIPGRLTQGRHQTTTSSRENKDAVNPAQSGTKAAAHYSSMVPAGGSATIKLRLSKENPAAQTNPLDKRIQPHLPAAPERSR